MALYALSRGNIQEAIDYFNKAWAIDPDSEKIYLMLSTTYVMSNQLELAVKTLKRGIKLIPGSLDIRVNLGNIYNKMGKFNDAIGQYKYILDNIDPDNSYIHFYLATTNLMKKENKEAENFYKKAIQLDPNNVRACNDLAWFYAERDQNLDRRERFVKDRLNLRSGF